MNEQPNLYYYNAHVTKVYDGDTVTCDIDLGFGVILKKQSIRLLGINTPELRDKDEKMKAAAYEARDFLRSLILDKTILLQTIKDKTGKYGRILGNIYYNDENINQMLIDEGYAVPYLD